MATKRIAQCAALSIPHSAYLLLASARLVQDGDQVLHGGVPTHVSAHFHAPPHNTAHDLLAALTWCRMTTKRIAQCAAFPNPAGALHILLASAHLVQDGHQVLLRGLPVKLVCIRTTTQHSTKT